MQKEKRRNCKWWMFWLKLMCSKAMGRDAAQETISAGGAYSKKHRRMYININIK